MPETNVTFQEDDCFGQDSHGRYLLKLVQNDAVEIIERLRETHVDVQGRAYLIRLSPLIERLGAKWGAKRDLVFDQLKVLFERKFQEPNWCIKVNDDCFLAVIPTLGEHKGALSAAELWFSIGQFFVGDVSRVAPPLFEALADDVDRMRLVPINLAKYFDRAEARPFRPPEPPLPTSAPEERASRPMAVGTIKPIEGRSASGTLLILGGRSFRIASAIEPVFEMKKLAMIGHRFEPIVVETSMNLQLDAKSIANLDWNDREQIDIANIEQGIKLLQMRSPEHRKMLMVVPAAFSTFASIKARSRLMPAIVAAAQHMGLKVLFEIRHLNGVPPGRVSEVVSMLKPYCMTSMGQSVAEPKSIAALGGCGLSGTCIDFERGKRDDQALETYLMSLSSAARTSTGACMVQGFNNLQEMAVARQAGVSHASVKASALIASRH